MESPLRFGWLVTFCQLHFVIPTKCNLTNYTKRKYATLHIYKQHRGQACSEEFEVYEALRKASSQHPGRNHIRTAHDRINIHRPGSDHWCLVQKPTGESLKDIMKRISDDRLPMNMLRLSLIPICPALDYTHTGYHLVHTGQKIYMKSRSNILTAHRHQIRHVFIETDDRSMFEEFVERKMQHPVARKLGGYPVYGSRKFRRPKLYGALALGDFGSAVRGDVPNSYGIQPDQYRCPEVLFHRQWSFAADIWNVGVMVS